MDDLTYRYDFLFCQLNLIIAKGTNRYAQDIFPKSWQSMNSR